MPRPSPLFSTTQMPARRKGHYADLVLANQYWHNLLSRDAAAAREQSERLNATLARFQVRFGSGPLCVYLKPEFIAPWERDGACRMVYHLMSLMEKAIALYLTDARLHGEFGLTAAEQALVQIEQGYPGRATLARLDGYFQHGRTWFLEFNVDSPAGAAYLDFIEHEVLALPIAQEFQRHFELDRSPRCVVILHALLSCYRRWGGIEWPTIAIVDWSGVATFSEFLLLQRYFEEQGYRSVIADPRELTFQRGRLCWYDTPISIVYRRALTAEIARRADECGALIEAARANAVCMVNSFQSKIGGNKALLALFTDPQYERYFTDIENRARRNHLPWTARVREQQVLVKGEAVDCLPFLRAHRADLVLKPSSGYGGESVVVGPDVTPEAWEAALEQALGKDYVAQAFVPAPEKVIPEFTPDLAFVRKKININPYAVGGHYAGSLSRVSASSIINVGQGGGIIPVLPCRKRAVAARRGPRLPDY